MVVLAWLNLCFITTVLLLYTLRVPKRWLSFPGNLMLTMLLVQLPVSANRDQLMFLANVII